MSNEDNDKFRRLIKSEDETQGEYRPAPQKTSGTTAKFSRPALDKDNMPLPRRVDEIDMDGTRVTRAAYEPTTNRKVGSSTPSLNSRKFNWRSRTGCILRVLIAGLFAALILGLCTGSYLLYQYYKIASALPEIGDLRERVSQFETTRIMDRNGQLLYEILDPTAGRRTYIPLEEISPNLIAATIANEDKDFYNHPGFDVLAMIRALWQNYQSGGTVSGASTITQQLARALLLSPEERVEITYSRKTREIIL